MKVIKLTKGKVALVDDEDYSTLNKYNWHAQSIGNTFYARRTITITKGVKRCSSMHREILSLKGDATCDVDHINHDGLDNQRKNLRVCNRTDNMGNCKPHEGRKYKGVHLYKRINRYSAQLCYQGVRYFLGYYDTAEQAAKTYDEKAKELFGEFAYLNFDSRIKVKYTD